MNNLATRALTTAALVTGTLITFAAPASASHGGGGAVQDRGSCHGGGTFKLQAKHDDGRIEVEYEVDSNRAGQVWHHGAERLVRDPQAHPQPCWQRPDPRARDARHALLRRARHGLNRDLCPPGRLTGRAKERTVRSCAGSACRSSRGDLLSQAPARAGKVVRHGRRGRYRRARRGRHEHGPRSGRRRRTASRDIYDHPAASGHCGHDLTRPRATHAPRTPGPHHGRHPQP